jgi:hypothetical protein
MYNTDARYEPLPPLPDEVHTPFRPFSQPTADDDRISAQEQSIPVQALSTAPASSLLPFAKPDRMPLSGRHSASEAGVKESRSRWAFLGRGEPGWRSSARLAAATALLTLVINIGALAWAARMASTSSGLLVRIYQGACRKVETMNTWVHFAINALSTALLCGSNYCMQCLSAPTRKEIDRAHAHRKWLDIGVYSLRNLSVISRKKRWLWWLLGLSSVPLHLMYNSAFFSSLASYDYNVVYANEGWLTGTAYNATRASLAWSPSKFDVSLVQQSVSKFQRLTNARCIEAYATDFTPDRRTVVVVCNESSSYNGIPLLDGANGGHFVSGDYGW